MKRILITAAPAATLILHAAALASASGAERAVKREVVFDYDDTVSALSSTRHRRACRYYTRTLAAIEGHVAAMHHGRARVWQYGRSHDVNHRIDW
jgi:hypothetical protein